MTIYGVPLEDIASISTALGGVALLCGFIVFWWNVLRDRKAKEVELYLRSCDNYIAYLGQISTNPDAYGGEFGPLDEGQPITSERIQKCRQYTHLFMLMEQTFYIYNRHRAARRSESHLAWRRYFIWHAQREEFQSMWKIIDPYIIGEFRSFIESFFPGGKHYAQWQAFCCVTKCIDVLILKRGVSEKKLYEMKLGETLELKEDSTITASITRRRHFLTNPRTASGPSEYVVLALQQNGKAVAPPSGRMHSFIGMDSTVQSVLLRIKQGIADEADAFLVRL